MTWELILVDFLGEEPQSFLSKEYIKKRIKEIFRNGTYDEGCFSSSGASYDLRLGKEVFITPEKEPKLLKDNQVLMIESGQFAVLMTHEYLTIPQDLLGFITIRFTYKSKGLINISGFHVDPGFEGHLVFSVYNIGPTTVALRQGDKVFSVFFAKIYPPTTIDERKALFNKISKIPRNIIESLAGSRAPSLGKLEENINRNWTYIQIYGVVIFSMLLTLLLALITR